MAMADIVPAYPPRPAVPLRPFAFLMQVRRDFLGTFDETAFDEEFIARKTGSSWTFVANCPAAVKHVLFDRVDNYPKSRVFKRVLKPLIGNGLLTSEAEQWRRQRRIMAPAFQNKRFADFAQIMVAATGEMLTRWTAFPSGQPVEIANEMRRVSLDIILRTMFSTGLDAVNFEQVTEVLANYQTNAARVEIADLLNLPEWFPRLNAWRAREGIRIAHQVTSEIVSRRRADGTDHGDLLSLLINARDPETGEGMSDVELRDEVATIFGAGHETTASAMAWTFYLLALAPSVRAKLDEELDRVLAGRAPSFEDVLNLVYTRMIVDEAVRLYPPIWATSREAIEDDEIMGQKVPKGSLVIVAPWLLHRHRKIWPDPDRFDPERFRPEAAAARPRFSYIPFGAGPHICIGMPFALTEAVLILATVAQRHVLSLAPGREVMPMGGLSLRPRDGIYFNIANRA